MTKAILSHKSDTPTQPLSPITYDPHDPVLTGLRMANAIWLAVYGPPLPPMPKAEA